MWLSNEKIHRFSSRPPGGGPVAHSPSLPNKVTEWLLRREGRVGASRDRLGEISLFCLTL